MTIYKDRNMIIKIKGDTIGHVMGIDWGKGDCLVEIVKDDIPNPQNEIERVVYT